jgi:hypothetical protein
MGLDQLSGVEELPPWRWWSGRRGVRARCRHVIEYNVAPTLAWMSGPTRALDQVASTNGARGNAPGAGASTAANTAAGAAP